VLPDAEGYGFDNNKKENVGCSPLTEEENMSITLTDDVASEVLSALVQASEAELVKTLLEVGVVPTRTAFWLATHCADYPTNRTMQAVRKKYPYNSLKP
jgi:hypothetical protein